MKYKLLSIENKNINNIGDYIQALASSQFLPQIDGYINRDELSNYRGEDCKVIMNGWFMHNPLNWPPNSKIHPLFISFHINKMAASDMLDEKGLSYLKQYEPIGCRDEYTRDLLISKGVEAYFSGCLTLTLGNKYKSTNRNSQIYFVDPIIPQNKNLTSMLKDLLTLFTRPFMVCTITKKQKIYPSLIKNLWINSRFVRLYARLFTKDTLLNAVYIKQEDSVYSKMTNEERLKEAEQLVKLYSQASLVITKRIHCALPCLGLETPVYFIRRNDDNEISACRFGGLMELFNTITLYGEELTNDFLVTGKISVNNIVENKNKWVPLARSITDVCTKFINKDDIK